MFTWVSPEILNTTWGTKSGDIASSKHTARQSDDDKHDVGNGYTQVAQLRIDEQRGLAGATRDQMSSPKDTNVALHALRAEQEHSRHVK
jgi:hypothetical protein